MLQGVIKITKKMKTRLTNIYMYLGMVSTILLATGLDITSLATWKEFVFAILGVVASPSKLLCLSLAILSAIIDPTTKGITDKHHVTKTTEKPVGIEENNISNDEEEGK